MLSRYVAWTVVLVVILWTYGHVAFASIVGSLMAFGIVVGLVGEWAIRHRKV